jgi:hypothetical protein
VLVIRSEQINAMVEAMANDFAVHVRQRLRAERAELIAHLSDAAALDEINELIDLARYNGFSIKSVVFRFIVLRLEEGPDFDSPPEVRRLLLDATEGEKGRIAQTEEYFRRARKND